MKNELLTPNPTEEGLENQSQETALPATKRSIPRVIIDSLLGKEMDYTKGSINKAILLLAIPMILEMLMESIFAVVDVYFVGKLGASAVATVGLTESLLTLMYSVAMGFAMATTAMVARRIGEKNKEGAADAAIQALIVAIITSIPFAIVGLFSSKEVLALMGADSWTIEYGSSYTQWMLGGNIVIMLIFIINAIFRGAGDALIAMIVLVISNGINIVLDPALIFGWGPFPELGLKGAAIATNIGRGTGVAFQLLVLFFGTKKIRLLYSQLRLNVAVMWQLIKTSLGGIGQFIIATSSWIGLMRIIAEFGSESVAGYTIAIRIFIFTLLPSWGLSNAAATLVGQNLGANQPDRAERSVWITGFINMAFLGVVSFFYILFCDELVGIFTDEATVLSHGTEALTMFSYAYIIIAWALVIPQAFNGAGDTMTPTYINLFCFWLLEIPLAYFLAMHSGWDQRGVYWSIVIAESTMAVISIWLFRKGKWKTVQV